MVTIPQFAIRFCVSILLLLDISMMSMSAEEWWRVSNLDNAKSLALMFDRESRRHFMYREGNIAKSDYQLEMFFEVARSPWIRTICETGFNAGHSAAVFLIANPSARLITFDLGQFEYTMHNLRLAAELFPDRFEYVLGDSYYSLPDIINKYPDLRCDLVFVDGSHTSEGAYNDIKNFHKIASCRNWLLADDTGFKEVNTAWQRAKDEGVTAAVICAIFPGLTMKIKVKKIYAVAAWRWKTTEEDCAICCQPFDATCGECKIPGDNCPPVWGECGHHFHVHCISRWINDQKPCPMCRREFKPVAKQ